MYTQLFLNMIKLIIFDLGKVILDFSLSMIAEGFARHSNNYLYANPQNIVDYMLGPGMTSLFLMRPVE